MAMARVSQFCQRVEDYAFNRSRCVSHDFEKWAEFWVRKTLISPLLPLLEERWRWLRCSNFFSKLRAIHSTGHAGFRTILKNGPSFGVEKPLFHPFDSCWRGGGGG